MVPDAGAQRRLDEELQRRRISTDEWAGSPRAYLGVAVAGDPNPFTITGPGSPAVLTNMVTSIGVRPHLAAARVASCGRLAMVGRAMDTRPRSELHDARGRTWDAAERVNSLRIRRTAMAPERRPTDAARPSSWRALLLGAPPAA